MAIVELILAILIAYLFGSLSSAIIVCRLMGLPDPRQRGSSNPGATNVLRIGGKKAAFITLLGDMLKGFIPVYLAKWYGFTDWALGLIAIAAFLGHLLPIFFKFNGGKGVATALGCLLALSWPAGLAWIGTWLILAGLFRYSSLASMLASALTPAYLLFFTHNLAYSICYIVIFFALMYRHRLNILLLIQGKERKLGKSG